jgi:hypothetical protein
VRRMRGGSMKNDGFLAEKWGGYCTTYRRWRKLPGGPYAGFFFSQKMNKSSLLISSNLKHKPTQITKQK